MALLIFPGILRQPLTLGEWISLGSGMLLSIPMCLYIQRFLHPRAEEIAHIASPPKWAVVIGIVGGPILGMVSRIMLGEDLTDILALAGGISVFILFVFMAIQVWRQRPEG
jgi:hypothetical protein